MLEAYLEHCIWTWGEFVFYCMIVMRASTGHGIVEYSMLEDLGSLQHVVYVCVCCVRTVVAA